MKHIFTPTSIQTGLLALALTGSGFIAMQAATAEPASDPFLEAMIQEQKEAEAQGTAPSASAATSASAEEQQEALRAAVMANDPRFAEQAKMKAALEGESGIFSISPTLEGKRISAVRVRSVNGTQRVPSARILDQISSKSGQKFSTSRVNGDLERLVKEGLIAPNSRVLVEESGESVAIIFEIGAANLMGGVGFTGNARFKENTLRELTKLKPGVVLNDKALAAARAA
ncbi:MAG: hypothetical protein R3Y56_10300, partial [Akkermansia sp.]